MPPRPRRRAPPGLRLLGCAPLLGLRLLGCAPLLGLAPGLAGCADGPLTAESIEQTPEKFQRDIHLPCYGYHVLGTIISEGQVPLTIVMDMQGEGIHSWPLVGYPSRMLPGGQAMGGRFILPRPGDPQDDITVILQLGWEGDLRWAFRDWQLSETHILSARQHHDFQREGNPVGYYAPGQEARSSGSTLVLAVATARDSPINHLPHKEDTLYEVDAQGKLMPFTWEASAHFDEMGFDASARADIREHMFDYHKDGDWLHLNSMSRLGRNRWYELLGDERFHPQNILISSREASLLAIISYATGRIVWRVGPDFGEGQPEAALGQLVGQHHAHMIPHGLPGAGNILVYDNGGFSGYGGPTGYPRYGRQYSRVLEFNPVTLKKIWEFGGDMRDPNFFLGIYVGSAQRLPNGNTLITNGVEGTLLEVTWKTKQVVYRHDIDPTRRGWISQVYRCLRVPPEWLPGGLNPAGYPAWEDAYAD